MHIGIVGGGFSGVALAAQIYRQAKLCDLQKQVTVTIFEKRPQFALGEAYSTPYDYHWLNATAKEMSAFDDDPYHFVKWLKQSGHAAGGLESTKVENAYVPRPLYGAYLQQILTEISGYDPSAIKISMCAQEVKDLEINAANIKISTKDNLISVDKLVLALGHVATPALPPSIQASNIICINEPWNYTAPTKIPAHDNVLILGTGLSMIDTVLTLYHHGHCGKIYAISRRGLLPLPHSLQKLNKIDLPQLPLNVRDLTKRIRNQAKTHMRTGGDWREIIASLRMHIPNLWQQSSIVEKSRFLRHLLPYWNVHRHRIHPEIHKLIEELCQQKQLSIYAARLISAEYNKVKIKFSRKKNRHAILEDSNLKLANEFQNLAVQCIINCMGPTLNIKSSHSALLTALLKQNIGTLDALSLGLVTHANGALKNNAGIISERCYALGPMTKSSLLETVAVPEIRKQCLQLAKHLLK